MLYEKKRILSSKKCSNVGLNKIRCVSLPSDPPTPCRDFQGLFYATIHVNFWTGLKYAVSHLFSLENPPFLKMEHKSPVKVMTSFHEHCFRKHCMKWKHLCWITCDSLGI
jgi:hypothetical protein